MQKILVIQTAFIGDVVLATALVEKLADRLPGAGIDFLVRKGNENLLANHPHLRHILIWDKKENKQRNLFRMLYRIRREHYDMVINLQRFFATGLLTAFSGAKQKIGFDKNPLSFLFTQRVAHIVDPAVGWHEVDRNDRLITQLAGEGRYRPKLYPSTQDMAKISGWSTGRFITISPTSVWFTKQFPPDKWVVLIDSVPADYTVYLLGGPDNKKACEDIQQQAKHEKVQVLAGQLSFLQSAALMEKAAMNYVNDSAPLHFASAMNAPVAAVFCSTVPAFGFTPLSDKSFVIETTETLTCRPCGLHGKKACPLGHFKCATSIEVSRLLDCLTA